MKDFRLRAVALLSAAVTLLCPNFTPIHGQALRTTISDLADASDAIVVARTRTVESYWNKNHSAILTRVVLDIDDRIQGSTPRETVVIVPGGRVGNIVHEVSDMAVFTEGEESVVFVERHASGVNVVAGGSLGKLTISDEPVTHVRTVVGAEALLRGTPSESTDTPSARTGKHMRLDTFIREFKNRDW